MIETWKPIQLPSIGDIYEVSDQGRIRRRVPTGGTTQRSGRYYPAGHILTPKIVRGYAQYGLRDADKIRHWHSANRLVALTFIGPPPSDNHHSAHNDGNKLNNQPSNLRWATVSENNLDKRRHGRTRKQNGEMNHAAKLATSDVLQIRQRYAAGNVTHLMLAQHYGVRRQAISRIISGDRWAHLEIKQTGEAPKRTSC